MSEASKLILDKHIHAAYKTIGVVIPESAKEFILRAMDDYTSQIVNVALPKERRHLLLGLFSEWKAITWHEFMINRRIKNLKKYKRIVNKLSKEENRKYYVVRSSETNYVYFSSREMEFNKRVRVFGKHINAKELRETADYTVTPK